MYFPISQEETKEQHSGVSAKDATDTAADYRPFSILDG